MEGRYLRTIAGANKLVSLTKTQTDFDELVQYLSSDERLIVIRAADAIEKRIRKTSKYLTKHKQEVIRLIDTATEKGNGTKNNW